MKSKAPQTLENAAAILERLTVDDVLARLDKIEAEKKSLKVILRSLRARDSSPKRKAGSS